MLKSDNINLLCLKSFPSIQIKIEKNPCRDLNGHRNGEQAESQMV